MKARVLTTASLLSVFAGSLPAADPQLMKLVMADVKVMSDVNVMQARLSPFGQFVLSQMESSRFQQLIAETGFDPRQDLIELLVVSNGAPGAANSLALASGVFNPTKIAAAATASGATQETYSGVAIIESPKKTEGIAFLSSSIVIAGSVANVRAAIDRQAAPATLPPSLVTQANQLSVTQDAWALSTVSPAALAPANAPQPPAVGGVTIPPNILQQVQSGYVGVKFGSSVAFTAQAQSDTAEDATALAGLVQLLGNLAQMQTAQNPGAAAFAKSLTVTATGTTVNISASVPEAQFQQLLTPKAAVQKHLQGERK
ncbi:MAG: hypothetical protein ABSG03_28510 [Bryobacteraceae bacterium]|jgi:hypothetical protein